MSPPFPILSDQLSQSRTQLPIRVTHILIQVCLEHDGTDFLIVERGPLAIHAPGGSIFLLIHLQGPVSLVRAVLVC